MNNIRVLHIVSDFNIISGGQSSACFSLASLLVDKCDYVAVCFKLSANRTLLDISKEPKRFDTFPYLSSAQLFKILFLDSIITKKNINIVHFHGMWLPIFICAFVAAKIADVKIVVSPHGTLLPWDLERKKLKKWLALKLYQGWILRNVEGFIASSEPELQSIKLLELKSTISTIPIAILEPNQLSDYKFKSSDIKTALFVGRINPGKGLHTLIEAWASLQLSAKHKLIIAGPASTLEEVNYLASLVESVERMHLQDSISFAGLVEGMEKIRLFEEASFFVLPTFSENYGMVVAEALAFSLPVITTYGAPWRDLEDQSCGWWIPVNIEYLKGALAEALSKSPEELFEMGLRGRRLFEKKYSSNSIAISTINAYSNLIKILKH